MARGRLLSFLLQIERIHSSPKCVARSKVEDDKRELEKEVVQKMVKAPDPGNPYGAANMLDYCGLDYMYEQLLMPRQTEVG